ncbi:hypothetical protein DUNSADRAFT_8014 [Dunaliella salina]|uniref:Encoded protein n=1 Tax=Dunaliella salina TaxID=3046 RepID=A0ABQ7GK61_DUNSA|nr:hypothetical protein DUNSADRAFT_8014 [Dunaliella salina]|eukprot:KAF5835011.1 hypothetical protein DUNSADRAFT_8014 [Dunaliella salina]
MNVRLLRCPYDSLCMNLKVSRLNSCTRVPGYAQRSLARAWQACSVVLPPIAVLQGCHACLHPACMHA